jgi:hypothetical protein
MYKYVFMFYQSIINKSNFYRAISIISIIF